MSKLSIKDSGWISLSRSIFYTKIGSGTRERTLADDPGALVIFLVLLMNAEYEDVECDGVIVPRGHASLSQRDIAGICNQDRSKVRRSIKLFESEGMIVAKTTEAGELIYKIVNYDKYQKNARPTHLKSDENPLETRELDSSHFQTDPPKKTKVYRPVDRPTPNGSASPLKSGLGDTKKKWIDPQIDPSLYKDINNINNNLYHQNHENQGKLKGEKKMIEKKIEFEIQEGWKLTGPEITALKSQELWSQKIGSDKKLDEIIRAFVKSSMKKGEKRTERGWFFWFMGYLRNIQPELKLAKENSKAPMSNSHSDVSSREYRIKQLELNIFGEENHLINLLKAIENNDLNHPNFVLYKNNPQEHVEKIKAKISKNKASLEKLKQSTSDGDKMENKPASGRLMSEKSKMERPATQEKLSWDDFWCEVLDN